MLSLVGGWSPYVGQTAMVLGWEQSDALLVAGAGHVVSAAIAVALEWEQSSISFVAGAGHMVPAAGHVVLAAGTPLGEASAEAPQDIVDSTLDVSSHSLDTRRWWPCWLCVS